MDTDKHKRNVFSTANKCQERIILVTFLPSIFIFFSFILIVFIGNPIIARARLHDSYKSVETLINQFSSLIVILMCIFLVLSVMGAFIISNRTIGAHGRIIKELDEIIAGRSKEKIIGRPQDELTNDLLKRINVLVENFVKK